jgi:Uma2 family endonuclease
MSVALPHRFTVEEYFRMAGSGVLAPGAKVELMDGEVVDMLPIGPFHSGSVNYLAEIFTERSHGRWQVAVQSPLLLGPHDMPEPDVMLLRRSEDRYKARHPAAGDVYLIIEVSDSSLAYDLHTKVPLYARAGIPEVWILNVPQKQLEVYRDPGLSGYGSKTVLRDGEAAPALFPDATVPVAGLVN